LQLPTTLPARSKEIWHDTRTMTPLFPVVRVLGRVSIEVLQVQGR
jgi:hypothetical protein